MIEDIEGIEGIEIEDNIIKNYSFINLALISYLSNSEDFISILVKIFCIPNSKYCSKLQFLKVFWKVIQSIGIIN